MIARFPIAGSCAKASEENFSIPAHATPAHTAIEAFALREFGRIHPGGSSSHRTAVRRYGAFCVLNSRRATPLSITSAPRGRGTATMRRVSSCYFVPRYLQFLPLRGHHDVGANQGIDSGTGSVQFRPAQAQFSFSSSALSQSPAAPVKLSSDLPEPSGCFSVPPLSESTADQSRSGSLVRRYFARDADNAARHDS